MKNLSILLLVIPMLNGCVFTSAPNQNQPNSNITTIESLAGCYKNQGEGENNTNGQLLSQIIWPEYSYNHSDIEAVSVLVESDKVLYVTGVKANTILIEKKFTQDKDFTLDSGAITIKNQLFGSLLYPSGNPAIGVGHESVTLGLDVSGNGKLTERSAFGGTLFIFFPIAAHVTAFTRFQRLGDSCNKS